MVIDPIIIAITAFLCGVGITIAVQSIFFTKIVKKKGCKDLTINDIRQLREIVYYVKNK